MRNFLPISCRAWRPAIVSLTLVTAFAPRINASEKPFGYHPASIAMRGRADFSLAHDMGVVWHRDVLYAFWFLVQPNLASEDFQFGQYDLLMKKLPADMRLLMNIAPEGDRIEGRCRKGSWQPVDEDAYSIFVQKFVERYDGDGFDDMPGLKTPVKHWQVGNEPDMPSPFAPPRKDFYTLQKLTYEAVKKADPHATVLLPGFGGGKNEGGYMAAFDKHFQPILDKLIGCYADAFDFHWYVDVNGSHLLREIPNGANIVTELRKKLIKAGFPPDLPIWCTEMGAHSGSPGQGPPVSFKSERRQAEDIVRAQIIALASGVQVVFGAWGLMEGQMTGGNHYFDQTGLIYDGQGGAEPSLGTPKLAYYAYSRMTALLRNAAWQHSSFLMQGENEGLWLIKIPLKDDGKMVFFLWREEDDGSPAPGVSTITLQGVQNGNVNIMSAIPHLESGAEVARARDAFRDWQQRIVGQKLTIAIGCSPLYIVASGK